MKLFSFPLASLEKAIHKRVLTLPSPHKEWFAERWAQKPYKKAFLENKAMPLVTLVAKGKTMDDAAFAELLQEWEVTFYDAEEEVLRPLIRFGPPLYFREGVDLRKATDEIMAAIQELSGQEYIDVYASSLKKG